MTEPDKQKQNGAINDGILYTRNLILRLMCGIYMIAFAAFYYQSPGLFGNNGILPARLYTETKVSIISAFIKTPTLLHFAPYLGIDAEYMIDLLCIIGILVSLVGLVSTKFCLLPAFATLWALYFSLYQVTNVFGHQSDQLLLEAGFICLLLVPICTNKHSSPTDKIAIVLLKWLLMRFLFESGSVKIISRCPKWWQLKAFEHYFETLPLPSVLSYYSHHLPSSILKATNIFANLSELVVPWYFFFPHRAFRRVIFYWEIYLQICIFLTGNYGLQTLLVFVLLITLLDDDFFQNKTFFSIIYQLFKSVFIMNGLFFIAAFALSPLYMTLAIKPEFLKYLVKVIPIAPTMALIVLVLTFLHNLISHPMIICTKSLMQKLYAINTTIGCTMLAIILLIISMVPHGNLDNSTNINDSNLGEYYESIKRFHVVNQYGMHLRKMRTERIEVVYEYSQTIEGPWTEYPFLYKPSSRNKSLPLPDAYLPRLDFKFYEVGDSNYRDHLWTASLAYRLLQNEEKVLKLMGIENPIDPPPIYVKAGKFRFWYTTMESKYAYWTKAIRGEFLPIFSADSPILISYLRSLKISPNYVEGEISNTILKSILDFLRHEVNRLQGTAFIWAIITIAVILLIQQNIQF